MPLVSSRTKLAGLAALTALGSFAAVGTATAATTPVLNGSWAPFSRCPVDAAPMLAADGLDKSPQCVSSFSANGTIKLGNSTVVTGKSDLQLGIVQNPDGTSSVVAPAAGAIIADSATVPGGLLGLMCPNDIPLISDVCKSITNADLNKITATLESVGTPSDFDQIAGVLTDQPIVTIPVRVHLENPILGSNCYIGTKANPILLRPRNLDAPAFGVERFDGNGSANEEGDMSRLNLLGSTQVDKTFAVPGASGCGLLGILDGAVNLKNGLPSAAGKNSLVLNNTQTYLGGLYAPGTAAPNAGRTLAQNWHSAVK
ncbi:MULTISPECIES: hypothetical protein [unclassified Streptomyces]|uniref:hypothetical protein n=1 Tax=unclassified Streptomyces TaxID=2593676 RepID=UPI0016615190|nr:MULTISPECIES: hypothetical protein [unclassified Streptomyces]MBD0710176.1 hypothetical protein [Streptomyces sp. CBMA291]MBD0715354.1 hypothetical protein [Streptomyces sp. CBMA370]